MIKGAVTCVRWFAVVAVLGGAGLALPACQSVKSALEGLDRPSASIAGVRLRDLSLDSVALDFDIDVKNPYGVPLPLTGLDYSVGSGGSSLVSGSAPSQGVVPASGSKVITLPARVRFADVLSVLRGVKPGSVVPYEASLALFVDAPAAGRLSLPLSHRGELPVPAAPDVSVASLKWDELSFDRAAATIVLEVVNTNQFSAGVSRLSYELSLAGMPVGSGLVKGARTLKPGEREAVTIPVSFSPRSLGLAALEVLQGGDPSYALRGGTTLSTPFGDVEAPLNKAGTARRK